MIRIGEFILNVLLNSLWQIPAIWIATVVGTSLLKKCSAQYRYALWIVALSLCLIAPVMSAARFYPGVSSVEKTTSSMGERIATGPSVTPNDNDASSPMTHASKRSRQIEISASSKVIQVTLFGYALFILFCIIRLVRQWLATAMLKKTATDVGLPISIDTTARHCSRLFQLNSVSVMRSETVRVPCTLGIRQAVIVLPDSFCTNANYETILSVVAHEMAHVRRRDFLTKLGCEFISLPMSFHPIVGFIKRKIEREREMACDELVTRRAVLRETYARSLLKAADLSVLPGPRTAALSIFDGRTLEKRIKQLIENRFLWSRRTARTITVSVVAAVCLSSLGLTAFGFELRAQLSTLSPRASAALFNEEPVQLEPAVEVTALAKQQTRKNLDSPTPQERAQAACAAGRSGDLEAIPMLIAMLSDDSRTESMRCWETGRWGPALDTFKHPSPGEEAALALASMGRPAFAPLVNQLDNSNPTARRNAAWAIGELTNMLPGERASAATGLVALLNDADGWVRMAAARALGELRDRRATERLIAMLLDSDWRARQIAAWALSELKDDRAVAALGNALLSDPRAEVRRGAAEALGEIDNAEALPFLRQAVNDPEPAVSAKVHWAIAEIEDTDG